MAVAFMQRTEIPYCRYNNYFSIYTDKTSRFGQGDMGPDSINGPTTTSAAVVVAVIEIYQRYNLVASSPLIYLNL